MKQNCSKRCKWSFLWIIHFILWMNFLILSNKLYSRLLEQLVTWCIDNLLFRFYIKLHCYDVCNSTNILCIILWRLSPHPWDEPLNGYIWKQTHELMYKSFFVMQWCIFLAVSFVSFKCCTNVITIYTNVIYVMLKPPILH
jgi:hypothetical protein